MYKTPAFNLALSKTLRLGYVFSLFLVWISPQIIAVHKTGRKIIYFVMLFYQNVVASCRIFISAFNHKQKKAMNASIK